MIAIPGSHRRGILKWSQAVFTSDSSEVPGQIFFKLCTAMRYRGCLMHVNPILALCQNMLIMGVFILILRSLAHNRGLDGLFSNLIVNKWYGNLEHVKLTLALCQNAVIIIGFLTILTYLS